MLWQCGGRIIGMPGNLHHDSVSLEYPMQGNTQATFQIHVGERKQ